MNSQRLNPNDFNAIMREAREMRAAYIREAALRFGHWLARGFHRARPAH